MSEKMSTSRAAVTIAATQTAEAKKKRKRTWMTVSVDTTTVSSDVETIDVDNEKGDTESSSATAAPSARTPPGWHHQRNRQYKCPTAAHAANVRADVRLQSRSHHCLDLDGRGKEEEEAN
jgi:hypothetical protein